MNLFENLQKMHEYNERELRNFKFKCRKCGKEFIDKYDYPLPIDCNAATYCPDCNNVATIIDKEPIDEEQITEASYGGAFDIEDDQYFTKDDLDEFAEHVIRQVCYLFHWEINPELVSIYLEDNSELEMTISYNDYELSYTRGIDMRRIKTPDDLITKYAKEYISYFYNEIEDNQSEYLDYQGLDTRTGEDMDVNSDFWR